jgi:hypothetical protein
LGAKTHVGYGQVQILHPSTHPIQKQ